MVVKLKQMRNGMPQSNEWLELQHLAEKKRNKYGSKRAPNGVAWGWSASYRPSTHWSTINMEMRVWVVTYK